MPHLIYLAIGFPPAVKSCTFRMRETANLFCEQGWDVTVVTIAHDSWEREFGIDRTLCEAVDPRIRVVELPLARDDLNFDIRTYSRQRARDPRGWLKDLRRRDLESFPEAVFGSWRAGLEDGVLNAHAGHPADLFLVSPAPNTGLAAAWRLWSEHGVPYAVDYRDAWSLHTYKGTESFTRESPAGKWEHKVLTGAQAIWCVNAAIAGFYRGRYPEVAERIAVVQNGYDPFVPPIVPRRPDPVAGLSFGFVGTANFPADMLHPILSGWREARARNAVLARSRLVFRGHFGAGMARDGIRHVAIIKSAAADGVEYAGPVPKADLGSVYSEWDGLLLLIPGGRYVTAGKTYEYVATGLPIMSAHAAEHGACEVLGSYPLWLPPPSALTSDLLAESFEATARLAIDATDRQRAAAVEYASRYERRTLLGPAVRDLARSVVGRPATT